MANRLSRRSASLEISRCVPKTGLRKVHLRRQGWDELVYVGQFWFGYSCEKVRGAGKLVERGEKSGSRTGISDKRSFTFCASMRGISRTSGLMRINDDSGNSQRAGGFVCDAHSEGEGGVKGTRSQWKSPRLCVGCHRCGMLGSGDRVFRLRKRLISRYPLVREKRQ